MTELIEWDVYEISSVNHPLVKNKVNILERYQI